MKKLLLVLLALPMIGFGQFTYVPDDNFEQALINLGYDTFLDNNVTTASIDTVTYLNIDNQGIADLTGISDFTSLATLHCDNNQLSSLVVLNQSLLNLSCANNQMLNLDVSNNGGFGSLISIDCSFNQLTSLLVINNINLNYLNCSNNLLTTLNFGNTTLFDLNCSYNLFTELDVSSCNALVSLNCSNNDLNTLDVRNGNNVNITNANFNSTLNSNLNCIDVDNPPYSIANWLNIDAWSSFSINCPPVVFGCTDLLACNYNSLATIDDGSCVYLTTSIITTNITCFNYDDGDATTYPSGGTPFTVGAPYTYLWNTVPWQTTQTATNLPAGTFICTITDANGCEVFDTVTIIESASALANFLTILSPDILCFGDSTGTITTFASGGQAPYTYSWSGPNSYASTNDTISNLLAGTYSVIVTDSLSCEVYDTVYISEPPLLGMSNTMSGCDSVLIGNYYYSISGAYTDTLTSVNGCDSVVNTYLTIEQNTSSYDTLSVNASIVWNGMPLNISGDYSVTLPNSAGCDSIANLNLTVTTTGISDIANNKSKLIKITDMLGQETPYRRNTPLFYIYDDGTVEKKVVIE
jgi:hypothetical protein